MCSASCLVACIFSRHCICCTQFVNSVCHRTHIHTHTHTCMHWHECAHTFTSVHVHTQKHKCMQIHTHWDMHACTHTHTHTYTHMHADMWKHINKNTQRKTKNQSFAYNEKKNDDHLNLCASWSNWLWCKTHCADLMSNLATSSNSSSVRMWDTW